MPRRFVYQTPIRSWGHPSGLAAAAAEAVERASKYAADLPFAGWAYRVDNATYSVCVNPDYDEYSTNTQLEIAAFQILKRTDRGFRIRLGGWDHAPDTRWVSFAWVKQWASLTPEDAMRSYIARRQRQASIYESKAKIARWLVDKAYYHLNAAPERAS